MATFGQPVYFEMKKDEERNTDIEPGSITNGLDLMASYMRATYPKEVAEFVCGIAEVGDRPLKYEA